MKHTTRKEAINTPSMLPENNSCDTFMDKQEYEIQRIRIPEVHTSSPIPGPASNPPALSRISTSIVKECLPSAGAATTAQITRLPPSIHQMPIDEREGVSGTNQGSGPGQWSTSDRENLLEWFGRNLHNYQSFKTDKNRIADRISQEVYSGIRSGSSVKSQWEAIKKKYRIAQTKLNSTGEGQRYDSELWCSIRTNWLDKLCPYYEALDDILHRDKSFTPFYVSESGGKSHFKVQNNSSGLINSRENQFVLESETENNSDNGETEHPPAGGSKNPRKRGASSGTGKKGIKKEKISKEEEVFQSVQKERLMFERERFQYEIQRDESQRVLAVQREENRHEEALIRMRLLEKRLENPKL